MIVSGMGLCSPFGLGVDLAIAGLAKKETRATLTELGGFSVMAARVPCVDTGERRPAEAFLCAAIEEAVAKIDPTGLPLYVGTCSGEMQRFEVGAGPDDWYEQPGQGAQRKFKLGPVTTFTSACTSSLSAFYAAAQAIRAGRIERAIVAGTDAISTFAASGFFALKAASTGAAKPFSRERTGLNFGEGAAAIVLERAGDALARIKGVALSCDAAHVTAPRADALGLERAVKQLGGHDYDVYVTHGTATQANDAMELQLGTRNGLLGKPWLAHKAFIGHAMGASALMSFVLATEQIRRGADVVVPYGAWEDGVRLEGSLAGKKRALLAAAAFGGANGALAWEIA